MKQCEQRYGVMRHSQGITENLMVDFELSSGYMEVINVNMFGKVDWNQVQQALNGKVRYLALFYKHQGANEGLLENATELCSRKINLGTMYRIEWRECTGNREII